MTYDEIAFVPHNEIGADDLNIVNEHNDLIEKAKYKDAVALLEDNHFSKGFRASVFHTIQNKIHELEVYLLNKHVANCDELYSISEPTEEQMENKKFWIQVY